MAVIFCFWPVLKLRLRHQFFFSVALRPDSWSWPLLTGLRDCTYLTHNTHNRQTFMPTAGFDPAVPASEGPRIHALDRAVSGISYMFSH